MTSRRRTLLIPTLAVLSVGLVLGVRELRRPTPCLETFEQVDYNMTFREVCALVGGPPGNYCVEEPAIFPSRPNSNQFRYEEWLCDDCLLQVCFLDGRVDHYSIGSITRRPRSLAERLRAWLGREFSSLSGSAR